MKNSVNKTGDVTTQYYKQQMEKMKSEERIKEEWNLI